MILATLENKRDALDAGLTVDAWAEFDPESFDAAAQRCAADDWPTMAAELACDPGAGSFWRNTIRRRMEKELFEQVQSLEPWVVQWEGRFADEG